MPSQILHGYVYEAMFLNTGGALSDRELSGCAYLCTSLGL